MARKKKKREFNFNGCLDMYGACIALAMYDYNRYKKAESGIKLKRYRSARFFLFNRLGLERVIDEAGLKLSISWIRYCTKRFKYTRRSQATHSKILRRYSQVIRWKEK